jgi:glutaredoxin
MQGEARAEAIFSDDAGKVDLSRALSFDEYKKSGTEEQRHAAAERFENFSVSPFFEESAKKIDSPAVLLMIGMMYCPDCKAAYPYMEKLAEINPLIDTKYLVRNETPGAREFMAARTGRTNMPSIFVLEPDGTVLDGAYVETPARVTDMLAEADEAAREAIWDDFHSGVYDEDIQRDLISLILKTRQ